MDHQALAWRIASRKLDHPGADFCDGNKCRQVACKMQVKTCYCRRMPRHKPWPKRRSRCPLNASVEMLGDRWSLLIIRDMMLRGCGSYKDLLKSYEGIATNILADRLRRLESYGIIAARPDSADRRKRIYFLTRKGVDLAPVLAEMVLWAAAHEKTGNQPLIRLMKRDKAGFLAKIRRRWIRHDSGVA